MMFSYTDDAVVSSSPTGRHLSTVIRRPCVLLSGWDEHAAAICKALNELSPMHTLVSGLVSAAATELAGSLKDPVNQALTETVKRQYVELQELRPEVLAELRSSCGDYPQRCGRVERRGLHTPDDVSATMASGIFVGEHGTVRVETKQRGVHWRGKIPAEKTPELMAWARETGPHNVQQIREKCEELSAVPEVGQSEAGAWVKITHGSHVELKRVSHTEALELTLARVKAQDEELEHLRYQLAELPKGHINICPRTAEALAKAVPGDLVSNPTHTFRKV